MTSYEVADPEYEAGETKQYIDAGNEPEPQGVALAAESAESACRKGPPCYDSRLQGQDHDASEDQDRPGRIVGHAPLSCLLADNRGRECPNPLVSQ